MKVWCSSSIIYLTVGIFTISGQKKSRFRGFSHYEIILYSGHIMERDIVDDIEADYLWDVERNRTVEDEKVKVQPDDIHEEDPRNKEV